jgi:hypothetical protein
MRLHRFEVKRAGRRCERAQTRCISQESRDAEELSALRKAGEGKLEGRYLAGVAEQDDVAFLDDVFLAFEADLGFFAGGGEAACGEEIVPADDFGANETFFDVAVDGAGGFDGVGIFVNGPGAHFGFASGEEGSEAHQVVGGANEAVQARLFQAIGGEHLRRFGVTHFGKFGFQASADRDHCGVLAALQCTQLVTVNGSFQFAGFVVAEIQYEEHRPLRQKQKSADGFALFGSQVQFAQRLFGFEMGFALFQNCFFQFEILVGFLFEIFFETLEALVDLFEVGKNQFQFEVGDIAQRIDGAFGVRDAGIVEDADNVGDGVDFAERGEGFAHAFFLHAAEVDVLHRGVSDFFGVIESGELGEARLRDFGDADTGFLATFSWIDVGFGKDAEERGLSDAWQSDNSCLHKRKSLA